MSYIGGNINGTLQVCETAKNALGEGVKDWQDKFTLTGWLDQQSGDSRYTTHLAKLEESTHVFLCDYRSDVYALTIPDKETKTVPDCRMIVKGVVYDVTFIDNPMELNEHLEISLRKVGAWNG